MREIAVGLLADPGTPAVLAEHIRDDVARELTRLSGDGVEWTVRASSEQIYLDWYNRVPLGSLGAGSEARNDDVHVLLTDLPRHDGHATLVADASAQRRTALVSLPALGGFRLRRRAVDLVVDLIDVMAANDPALPALDGHRSGKAGTAVRRVSHPDDDVDILLVRPGSRGWLRLLAGMVRDNRPWRLVPQLSKALAAAAAMAAFGIFFPIVWSMADHLSPLRLTLISVFAVVLMVAWLILYNDMGERPGERRKVVLYNAATVITVLLGVLLMYVALFSLTLLGAVTVIPANYFSSQLGHDVSLVEYLALAWLASSLGTIAGAFGSSMETSRQVQHATFSRREQDRRAQAQRHGGS